MFHSSDEPSGRRDRVNPADRGRGGQRAARGLERRARVAGPVVASVREGERDAGHHDDGHAGSSGDGEESAIGPLRRAGMLRLSVRARLRRHGRGTIPTATSGPSDVRATVPRPHDDRIADHRSRRPRRGRGRCLARAPRPTSGVGRERRESARPRTGDARPRTPRDRGRGAARRRARHARRAGHERRQGGLGGGLRGDATRSCVELAKGRFETTVAPLNESLKLINRAGRGGRPCARAVLRRRHAAAQRSQRPHLDPRHGARGQPTCAAAGGRCS